MAPLGGGHRSLRDQRLLEHIEVRRDVAREDEIDLIVGNEWCSGILSQPVDVQNWT